MALQVWLPLNGDFINNGLTQFDDFVLPSGASWSAGKLGNNLNISNASTRRTITKLNNLKEFSISLWYKMKPDTTYTQWRDVIMVTDSISEFRLETVNTAGTATSWYGYGMNASGTGHIAVTTGVWYHDTVVVSGRTIKRYINGSLYSTTTAENDCQLAGDLRLGDTGMYCQIADVRIYDHCLSQKEVKELSKGIVCHYPLDNNGTGCPNLLKNTNKDISGWGWSSSGGSRTVTALSDGIGVRLESVTAGTSWSVLGYQDGNLKNTITAGASYTVSVDCRCSYVTTLNCTILDGNGQNYMTNVVSANKSTVAGQWVHLVWKLTANSSFTVSSQEIYITGASLTAGTYFEFKNIKMEEGTIDTPWCPNASDASYLIFNINGNKEVDTSGYCNHGTKSGTITYNSNTPRYSVATVFDGTSSGIEIQSSVFPVVLNGPFTVSMWVYDQETGGRSIFFGNWNLTGAFFNIEKEANNKARFYWSGNPDFHCTNSPIASNAWTHLVMTRDGNTVKCYINGILTDTSTATLSGTVPTNATIFRLGRDGRSDATMFKGCMSDFRLYATVLSESDIKELYNQPISFNKHSTMIQGEFIER